LHVGSIGSDYGGMEGFITVGFRSRDEIFQSFWYGGMYIGDDGINLPAGLLFQFMRHVHDNPNRKQVVYFLEGDVFLPDLSVDRRNRFGSPRDPVRNIERVDAGFEGFDKTLDVFVPLRFGLIEFPGNILI